MQIALIGHSGYIGRKLSIEIARRGDLLIKIDRDVLFNENRLLSAIKDSDVVINLAGENLIGRWTMAKKKSIYNSRINTTRALVQAINSLTVKPRLFINASAIGIYNGLVYADETTQNNEQSFIVKLCKDWEFEAKRANTIRVCLARFAVVLANDSAFVSKLRVLSFLGFYLKPGNKDFSLSFIGINDLVNAFYFLIDNENIKDSVNFAAPNKVSMQSIIYELKAKRFAFVLGIPTFLVRLVLGEAASVIFETVEVYPKRLLAAGFTFKEETVHKALQTVDNNKLFHVEH